MPLEPSADALSAIYTDLRQYLVKFGINANEWRASYRHGGSNWLGMPKYSWGDVRFEHEDRSGLSIVFEELVFNHETGQIEEYKSPRLEEQ